MAEKEKRNAAEYNAGMFDDAQTDTTAGAMVRGVLVGCAITVLMFLIWTVLQIAFAGADESTAHVLSFIVAGLVGGVFQQLWFNWHLSMRMRYPARIAGFGLSYFVVLFGCAWLGGWIPADRPMTAWASFAVFYLLVLVIVTIVVNACFRRAGKSYSKQLEEYRKTHAGAKIE